MFAVYLDDELVEYIEEFSYLRKNDNNIYETCEQNVANAIELKNGEICNLPETDNPIPELKNVRLEYVGDINDCLLNMRKDIDKLNNRIVELENIINKKNDGDDNNGTE